ncbi:hypothetical protein THAOC_33688 [Thalassiosira oceanica]|uniref:Fungal lipase-type domain-containing protein n=1 Tax=Thalassiosira oceanica TaxID=159749 RepID=K0R3R5_THAOC|nr:hypothetical protein THAOC_33688 [Thalassiosira oceanica]|eukprot:EJK47583.1 hypothetical protein THAOC_33688 [Thalassiosira oceanica]
MGVGLTYDTSLGGDADKLGSKAEMFFGFIRRVMSQIPYVGTTSSPGNLLYATACSMVVANMFLPSSLFRPSPKRERFEAEEVSAEREKKIMGSDKRLKFGRGAIYKGRYTPVFCIELACWLLEASWQAYYSTQFSVINVSIGAKAVLRATPLARQTLACVHKGFLTSYNSVRHELIEAIVAVLKRQLDNVVASNRNSSPGEPLTLPKIYLTGHSLGGFVVDIHSSRSSTLPSYSDAGGCLAQILALDLASNCEINIHQPISEGTIVEGLGVPACTSKDSFSVHSMEEEASRIWLGESLAQSRNTPTKLMRLRPALAVYTYGQPRVGNLAFKTVYKSRVPHTFRVITEGDAITSILTVGKGFSGIYRHAGLEVLLEDGCTGNILVGPTVVETLLRFTKVRTSMTAHFMDRYRESLESALSGAELKEYYSGHGGKVTHERNRIGLLHQGTSALPSWVTNVKRSRS